MVFDNVRPFKIKLVMKLASIIQDRGYGVILMHWRSLAGIGQPEKKWVFVEVANALILNLIHLNDIPSSISHCLSAGNVTINPQLGGG